MFELVDYKNHRNEPVFYITGQNIFFFLQNSFGSELCCLEFVDVMGKNSVSKSLDLKMRAGMSVVGGGTA